ncbi:MAG: MBOAT family protein [Chitinophagales bacterium]|nr:MBOAT family protein [Chitinophagales bacterium]
MVFNSLAYLIFLPLVTLVTFLFPQRWRWAWLLAASYFFYGWGKVEYLVLLLFSTFIAFFSTQQIAASEGKTRRKWLYFAVGIDVLLLCLFKYTVFFYANLQYLLAFFAIHLPNLGMTLILPPGISFYTFQSLSYTIEVYRRQQNVEKHFGLYALYIGFFPQLVAGPIEQAKHLLPQLKQQFSERFAPATRFQLENLISGGQLIVWGFFKKLVIADNIGEYLRYIFNDINNYGGMAIAIAMLLFVYQIYADFSAYSLIATGSARLIGIQLMLNFDRPFTAQSYSDIWRRWHISLTLWIRTYLYLPLGGRGDKRWQYYRNILVVYLLMGLWHGAGWTFVLFGVLHAVAFIVLDFTTPLRQIFTHWLEKNGSPLLVKTVYRSLVIALFAFNCFPFRCDDIGQWLQILRQIPQHSISQIPYHYLSLIAPLILFVEYLESYQLRGDYSPFERIAQKWWRWLVYVFLIFAIFLLGNHQSNTFYYFQF